MNNLLSPEITKNINKLFEDMAQDMDYFYGRWQDEKECEDWTEYEKCLKNNLSQVAIKNNINISIVKVTKRPFGISFNIDNNYVVFYANAKHIGWKYKGLN